MRREAMNSKVTTNIFRVSAAVVLFILFASTAALAEGVTLDYGLNLISFESNGATRTAKVYVPASYNAETATPVILAFHGASESADAMINHTRFNKLAESKGFVAVYPEGSEIFVYGSWRKVWNAGDCREDNQADDVGFVGQLLDLLEASVNVNKSRIYATGLSNGGMFAQYLTCELSTRIAAVVSVAGGMSIQTAECNATRKVPVRHIHGLADTIVPIEGGGIDPEFTISGCEKRSIYDMIDYWAAHNENLEETYVSYENEKVTCTTSSDSSDEAETTLCVIQSFGHAWPGEEMDDLFDYDASESMWTDFFSDYEMPETVSDPSENGEGNSEEEDIRYNYYDDSDDGDDLGDDDNSGACGC